MKNRLVKIIAIFSTVVLIAVMITSCDLIDNIKNMADENSEIESKEQAEETTIDEKEQAIIELIDTCVYGFRDNLKDPTSLQIHEVRLTIKYSSITAVLFDYSAKNSLGGVGREIAWITTSDGVITTTGQKDYAKLVKEVWDKAEEYEYTYEN